MNDTELDQLLRRCATPAQTPACFQRDVWLRIEAAEAAEASETGVWKARVTRAMERFLGCLAMPPVAVATCCAMVLAGVWFGLESGKSAVSSESSYARSISPFDSTHSR